MTKRKIKAGSFKSKTVNKDVTDIKQQDQNVNFNIAGVSNSFDIRALSNCCMLVI